MYHKNSKETDMKHTIIRVQILWLFNEFWDWFDEEIDNYPKKLQRKLAIVDPVYDITSKKNLGSTSSDNIL